MNIYLEILGYTGTVLIVISMMMTSLLWLRVVNISGSVFSAIYSILSNAWPIVLLNVCLIGINLFQIARYLRNTKAEKKNAADQSSATDNT